jgi:hypothetical protein
MAWGQAGAPPDRYLPGRRVRARVHLGRAAGPQDAVDVTFPGENEPDQVDTWTSAYAEPFYIRA